MLVDLSYFVDVFKTEYDIKTDDNEAVRTFEKFSNIAENFVMAICGIKEFVENNYSAFQIKLIKDSISIWVEHWLKIGFSISQGGTKSYQALGFNFSITNPKDPEFIPISIKSNLRRAGLYSSFYGVTVNGIVESILDSGEIDDTSLENLKATK